MWLLLVACAPRRPVSPAPEPPAPAPPAAAPGEPVAADRLHQMLIGRWDSATQAAEDPDYRAITLQMCAIPDSALGPRALYVEQAVAGQAPYRQRVYKVVPGATDDEAATEIFELAHPEAAAGWCDRGGPLDLEGLSRREGCDARMRWDGARFVGGTHERDCASELRGATWASSDITLSAGRLESWDRGWDDAGTQVWGAEKGPYRFEPTRP